MTTKNYTLLTGHVPSKRAQLEQRWRKLVLIAIVALWITAIYLLSPSRAPSLSQWFISPTSIILPEDGSHLAPSSLDDLEEFQNCSITNFLETGLPFLKSASPLPAEEFVERRNSLARALASNHIDAFVAEPGFTFKYYVNVSQADWEPWEPEERPFVMIVKPVKDAETGQVRAETYFLAPAFEAERVRLLQMPFTNPIDIITWEEQWNPYLTLRNSEAFGVFDGDRKPPKIMVDEEMRDFIQRGLSEHGFEVTGLSGDVERVRQIKSPREVEILRAVNTGTVEAVRQMRKCLRLGFTENEVRQVLDNTLRASGLDPFFDMVLFDDDASNPHGGTDGSKRLEEETLILIDVGAHLYGYSSDISRTFFAPYVPKPIDDSDYQKLSHTMREKLKVWNIVLEAQTQAIKAMKENNTAASVDIAARTVIDDAGYRKAFTHRLGHSIGIKAHESPYLNKGNVNSTLHPGMVFTAEPGIYLVGKFGVRHEDVLLVRGGDGEADVLSGELARTPWDP